METGRERKGGNRAKVETEKDGEDVIQRQRKTENHRI